MPVTTLGHLATGGTRTTMMTPNERFQAIVDEFGAYLRRAIRRHCPPGLGIDPEDVEQEVHLRIWRWVESSGQATHPRSYLYRTAVNATVDAIRQVKRRRQEESLGNPTVRRTAERQADSSPSADLPQPFRAVARRRMLEDTEKCLQALQAARSLAVRLYLQGFSVPEVANLQGWTSGSARNRVFRGLHNLRRCLATKGHTDVTF